MTEPNSPKLEQIRNEPSQSILNILVKLNLICLKPNRIIWTWTESIEMELFGPTELNRTSPVPFFPNWTLSKVSNSGLDWTITIQSELKRIRTDQISDVGLKSGLCQSQTQWTETEPKWINHIVQPELKRTEPKEAVQIRTEQNQFSLHQISWNLTKLGIEPQQTSSDILLHKWENPN